MIMNKAAWAAGRGFQVVDGGLRAPEIPVPEASAPEVDPVAAVQTALQEAHLEIQRQRQLIMQLQTALRSEVERRQAQEGRAGGQAAQGGRPNVRVVRRRRASASTPVPTPAPAPTSAAAPAPTPTPAAPTE